MQPESYEVVTDATGVLVEARSNVGPITFATASVSGQIDFVTDGDDIALDPAPIAVIELPVTSLVSGNSVYDAELRRRLNAQRFPVIRAELRSSRALGPTQYSVEGDLTIHGATRRLAGAVDVSMPAPDSLVLQGSQPVDIRDFDIGLPSLLMLKIYPDVQVRFRIEATRRWTG